MINFFRYLLFRFKYRNIKITPKGFAMMKYCEDILDDKNPPIVDAYEIALKKNQEAYEKANQGKVLTRKDSAAAFLLFMSIFS